MGGSSGKALVVTITTANLGQLTKMAKKEPNRWFQAYKLVGSTRKGVFYPTLEYRKGRTLTVEDANASKEHSCGKGINLATNDWCESALEAPYERIIAVKFRGSALVVVPNYSNGKFRVSRCTVLT
jgi:hypothetical protein